MAQPEFRTDRIAMPLLYALDLQITSSLDSASLYQRGLTHLADWLALPGGVDALAAEGQATVSAQGGRSANHGERAARWEQLAIGADFGIRVEVSQQLASDVEFTTIVTFAHIDGETTLRVVLSRQLASAWLSPVQDADLFQPGIVGSFSYDPDLELRVENQRIDRRFIPVLTEVEGREVARQLRVETRLPILLIHARNEAAREIGLKLPRRLLGLVRVITLNFSTSRAIARELPSVDVPYGGALLVWPGMHGAGIAFGPTELAELSVDGMRRVLIGRIAPLSALARGSDAAWNRLRRLDREREQVATESRIETARAADDIDAERAALRDLLSQLRSERDDWEALAVDADERARQSASAAATAQQHAADAEYWKGQYHALVAASPRQQAVDPWDLVPALVAASDPDATFTALENATAGRIIFTEAARRSWKNCDYPDAADMTAKLTALARAAFDLYDEEERQMPHLANWFKVEHAINVALTDQTIAKSKQLRDFEYEDKIYDQTPHLKVRDGVKPNQVGRIHFALDAKERRLIVNHVALKLYGI